MKGLILKDFLLAKSQAKTYLLLCIFYMILGFAQDSPAFFSGFVVIVAMMLPISSFSYDQIAHWDRYAASTPAGRRDLVRSKYVFALLILGVALVVCTVAGVIGCAIKGTLALLPELLASVLGCGIVGILLNSLLIPLIYKFDVEKGRVLMVIVSVVLFAGFMAATTFLGASNIKIPDPTGGSLVLILLLALAVALALTILSYAVAQKIFAKKEL